MGQVHVLEAGEPGQQRVVLEHHRALRPGGGNFTVVAQQHAAGGQGEPGNQVKQSDFAAARVADQRHKLAFGYGQIDVAQCAKRAFAGFESLLDVLDFDEFGSE